MKAGTTALRLLRAAACNPQPFIELARPILHSLPGCLDSSPSRHASFHSRRVGLRRRSAARLSGTRVHVDDRPSLISADQQRGGPVLPLPRHGSPNHCRSGLRSPLSNDQVQLRTGQSADLALRKRAAFPRVRLVALVPSFAAGMEHRLRIPRYMSCGPAGTNFVSALGCVRNCTTSSPSADL